MSNNSQNSKHNASEISTTNAETSSQPSINPTTFRAYNPTPPLPSTITANESYEAEPIEQEVERMLNNGEPLGPASPQIFTERQEGVLPEHDIRTDYFELAMDATELAARNQLARRKDFIDKLNKDNNKGQEPTTGSTTPD